jgi:replicative DNA helicase
MEDLASERGCLAGVMNYGADVYLEIAHLLDTDTFSDDFNQYTWSAIKNIFDKSPNAKLDGATFAASMRDVGLDAILKDKEYRTYIKSLKDYYVDQQNVKDLALRVLKSSVISNLKNKVNKVNNDLDTLTGSESIDEIGSMATMPIMDYIYSLTDHDDNPENLRQTMSERINNLLDNPRDICGLSSGYPDLDQLTGGMLRRGSVSVFAMRPGVGKTTMSKNIALHITGKLNVPVLFCDTEMNEDLVSPRLIANLAGVTIDDIEKGKASKDKAKRLKIDKAVERFEGLPFHYKIVNGYSFDQIVNYITRWVTKYVGIDDETGLTRDCLVIVDYLKVMNENAISKDLKEYQALGFAMQKLTTAADKLSIPILTMVQENKEGWISQSDRIVWLGATIGLMQEKTPEEIAEDGPSLGNRALRFVKTRFGQGMALPHNDYVCFNLNGKYNKLKEIGLRSTALANKDEAAPDDEEIPEF